jgi:RecJ-like exonuclease
LEVSVKRFMLGMFLVVVMLVPVTVVMAADEVPVVKATELVSLYRENEIKFNRNYLDKKVQVEGELVRVGVSQGAPSLTLKDGSLLGMFAYCKTSEMDAAADLDTGDTVVVVGKCEVALGKITLHDCVIKK